MGILKAPKGTVCDICGVVGYEESLASCTKCEKQFEHVYCVLSMLDLSMLEKELDMWVCEVCKFESNDARRVSTISDTISDRHPDLPASPASAVLLRDCSNASNSAGVFGRCVDTSPGASSTANFIVSNPMPSLPSSTELQDKALPEESLNNGRSTSSMNGVGNSSSDVIDMDIDMIAGKEVFSGTTTFSPGASDSNNFIPPLPPGSPPLDAPLPSTPPPEPTEEGKLVSSLNNGRSTSSINGVGNSSSDVTDMDIDMIAGKEVFSGTTTFSPGASDSNNFIPPLPPGSPPLDAPLPSTPPPEPTEEGELVSCPTLFISKQSQISLTIPPPESVEELEVDSCRVLFNSKQSQVFPVIPLPESIEEGEIVSSPTQFSSKQSQIFPLTFLSESIEEGEIVSSPINHTPQQSETILLGELSVSLPPDSSPAKPCTPPYSHEQVGSISYNVKLPLTNKPNSQYRNMDIPGKSEMQEVDNKQNSSTGPSEQSKNISTALKARPGQSQFQKEGQLSPHPKRESIPEHIKSGNVSGKCSKGNFNLIGKKHRMDELHPETYIEAHGRKKKKEIEFCGEDLHNFLLKFVTKKQGNSNSSSHKSQSALVKEATIGKGEDYAENDASKVNRDERTTDADAALNKNADDAHQSKIMPHHIERNKGYKDKDYGAVEATVSNHCEKHINRAANKEKASADSLVKDEHHGVTLETDTKTTEMQIGICCPNETIMHTDMVMQKDKNGQHCGKPTIRSQLSQGKEGCQVMDINISRDGVDYYEPHKTAKGEVEITKCVNSSNEEHIKTGSFSEKCYKGNGYVTDKKHIMNELHTDTYPKAQGQKKRKEIDFSGEDLHSFLLKSITKKQRASKTLSEKSQSTLAKEATIGVGEESVKNSSAENDVSKVNQDERLASADVALNKKQIGQHHQVIAPHVQLHHFGRNEGYKDKTSGAVEGTVSNHCQKQIKQDISGQHCEKQTTQRQFRQGKEGHEKSVADTVKGFADNLFKDKHHDVSLETQTKITEMGIAVSFQYKAMMDPRMVMKGDNSLQHCQMPRIQCQLSEAKKGTQVTDIDINIPLDAVDDYEPRKVIEHHEVMSETEIKITETRIAVGCPNMVMKGDTSDQSCTMPVIQGQLSKEKEGCHVTNIDINKPVDEVDACELHMIIGRNVLMDTVDNSEYVRSQDQECQLPIPEEQHCQGNIPIDFLTMPEKRTPTLCLPLLPNAEENVVHDTTGVLIDLVCVDTPENLSLVDQLDMPWYKNESGIQSPELELALVVPQYRKSGNVWIRIDSDSNCCPDNNITLSLSQVQHVV